MLILPKIILWLHLSKIEISTPSFEIAFWLVQNKTSMHDIYNVSSFINHLFISADNVRESIS